MHKIISINNFTVCISLNKYRCFLFECFVIRDIGKMLEVVEIYAGYAKCIIIGDCIGIKSGMDVEPTGKKITVKYSRKYVGRIVDPMLCVLSDNFNIDNSLEEVELCTRSYSKNPTMVSSSTEIIETGIKAIDFFCPQIKGGKCIVIGGAGVGKTTLSTEIIYNFKRLNAFTIFGGIGERIREGHAFYNDLVDSKIIDLDAPNQSNTLIVFGTMDQPPSIRQHVAYTSLSIAEYYRDVIKQDVLLFIDNIYRFSQAYNEISSSISRMPSELGYQPDLNYSMSCIQDRIYSVVNGNNMTSVLAMYVPADDMGDPAVVSIMSHSDSVIVLDRSLASKGIYPPIDPLQSRSVANYKTFIGSYHYSVRNKAIKILAHYKDLKKMIDVMGIDNLNDHDKTIAKRAELIYAYMTQRFYSISAMTATQGQYVSIKDTIHGFDLICEGEFDNIDIANMYYRSLLS